MKLKKIWAKSYIYVILFTERTKGREQVHQSDSRYFAHVINVSIFVKNEIEKYLDIQSAKMARQTLIRRAKRLRVRNTKYLLPIHAQNRSQTDDVQTTPPSFMDRLVQ